MLVRVTRLCNSGVAPQILCEGGICIVSDVDNAANQRQALLATGLGVDISVDRSSDIGVIVDAVLDPTVGLVDLVASHQAGSFLALEVADLPALELNQGITVFIKEHQNGDVLQVVTIVGN